MAAAVFRVSITNRHRARFDEMRRRGRSLGPQMAVIAVDMVKETEFNFLADGRREREPKQWKRLSEQTIARRKKGQRAGARILRASGDLLNSIDENHGNTFAVAGTPIDYAPKHQQFGRWGSSKVFEEVVEVPQHTRTVQVRTETSLPSPQKKKIRRAASVAETSKTAGKRAGRKPRDAGKSRKQRSAKRARGTQPRGTLTSKEVSVRAHRRRERSRIDARPFILLHEFMKRTYATSIGVYIDTGKPNLTRTGT